jgi:predicted Fe-Mo cluster-binding NifX family protein
MKLAIPLYGTRVSPRFGYSQQIMIVELDDRRRAGGKTLEVQDHFPEQIPELLWREGVEIVISGGMNRYFQDLFRSRGIQVIWGIIGEAEEVVAAFVAGRLTPGMGCCQRRRRGRPFNGGKYPP